MLFRFYIFLASFVLLCFSAGAVLAQTGGDVILPEGEPLIVSADGPALIKLEKDAASVIVGNPVHATAILDGQRVLLITPGQPGSTALTVLDEDGAVILNRKVLVNAPKTKYVRVNRVCTASALETCRQVSMYYCPKGCHEIAIPGQDVSGGGAAQEGGEGTPVADSSGAADGGDAPAPASE